MRKLYFIIILNSLVSLMGGIAVSQETKESYSSLNQKSWAQILEENGYKWQPPYTINLLMQPLHSPDWIYLNPSMTVSRRHLTRNISSTNMTLRRMAESQEDLVVQFAFDTPPFMPDFRLTNIRLAENKYPVVVADYFANDIYYKIEYAATSLESDQTLLSMRIIAKNESDKLKQVSIRTKIGYYPENKMFDYHYIPFYWNKDKWKDDDRMRMKEHLIYKENQLIGAVMPGTMKLDWIENSSFTDKNYEDILYPQVWYGSGYAVPEFRLKDIRKVICATQEIQPNDSSYFMMNLLINDSLIIPSHLNALKLMSFDDVKKKAIHDFKQPFTDQTLQVQFSKGDWDDILYSLQLSTLQFLIHDIQKKMYQPAQGGSSERFFVWVFEAVQMLRPLLRTGQFEPVKKALDFIFSLQDAGVPPIGKFTTTAGAIGTTGPRWANTTGMGLALACDYYLYSKDQSFIDNYLPKILKAMHWIAGEVKATRILNADGSRPLTYGLMPFAVASDGDAGYFISATDIFSFWGMEKAVSLLEQLQHKEAISMRKELEQYRSDLLVAIEHLAQPNGYIDRRIIIDDSNIQEAAKFINTDIMAPIATVGIISPESELFQNYIKYYENQVAVDYFMGKMDREIFYMIQCEHYWQPIYLMLGEWKKAFMTLQTCLKYGMSHDTHQTQERFNLRNPAFAPWQPNGSGNGRVIDMILNSLYFENGDEVILLGAVPFEYLMANQTTSLCNLYTLTGRVNLKVKNIDKNRYHLELSSDQPLPKKIRIPSYLGAVALDKQIKSDGEGIFLLKNNKRKVTFLLTNRYE